MHVLGILSIDHSKLPFWKARHCGRKRIVGRNSCTDQLQKANGHEGRQQLASQFGTVLPIIAFKIKGRLHSCMVIEQKITILQCSARSNQSSNELKKKKHGAFSILNIMIYKDVNWRTQSHHICRPKITLYRRSLSNTDELLLTYYIFSCFLNYSFWV